MVRSLALAILTLLAARADAARTLQDPPARLALTHLGLDLTLDYDAGRLAGTASLEFENVGHEAIRRIPLQVGRLMHVSRIAGRRGTDLRYSQEVRTYDDWPQLQINQVYVALDEDLPPGHRYSISVAYAGHLVGYTETGMQYVRDRVDREFTIIRSDAWAFPVLATPSLRERRAAPNRDFTFDARLTVPSDLVVAAAVEETDRVTKGQSSTWTFRGRDPVPFVNIAIAPYGRLETSKVRVYYFPDDEAGAHDVASAIDSATARYGRWFGPAAADARITVIEIPEGWGSQASLTGGIIQTADAFRSRSRMSQLYHELAHLWHPVDTDRPAVRWNEGLASFLQWRMASELDGGEPLDARMARSAARLVDQFRDAADRGSIPMIEYGDRELTGRSYSTGMLMFFVLFRVLGADDFDSALGAYFRAYRESGSTTEEFVAFIGSRAAPAIAVFDEWLFTTRWFDRLSAGETLDSIVDSHRLTR